MTDFHPDKNLPDCMMPDGGDCCAGHAALCDDWHKKDDRVDELEEAMQRIVQWSEAYPLDIFREPDWHKARELLEDGGITLDSVSAACMRHVIDGVGKIAREALDGKTLDHAGEVAGEAGTGSHKAGDGK